MILLAHVQVLDKVLEHTGDEASLMQYPKQINKVKGRFNPGVAKYRQQATLHFFNKYKISIYEDKRLSVAEGSCDFISGNDALL